MNMNTMNTDESYQSDLRGVVWKAPYLDVFTANATLRPTLLENWLENQVVQCSRF